MSFAHLTIATRDVGGTASFFERAFGYARGPIPGNSPVATEWLDLGHGQQIHVVYVDGFEVSPFEGEFGRHIALYHPAASFAALKARLVAEGAELVEPLRPTTFARVFVREPVNGYVLEVIAKA
jgi:hypothetical protein